MGLLLESRLESNFSGFGSLGRQRAKETTGNMLFLTFRSHVLERIVFLTLRTPAMRQYVNRQFVRCGRLERMKTLYLLPFGILESIKTYYFSGIKTVVYRRKSIEQVYFSPTKEKSQNGSESVWLLKIHVPSSKINVSGNFSRAFQNQIPWFQDLAEPVSRKRLKKHTFISWEAWNACKDTT